MSGGLRLSPVLAWSLLLALVVSLWAGLVLPVQDWSRAEQARLDQRRALLARQQALLETSDALSTALTLASDTMHTWPVHFGPPDSRRQTDFQAQLRRMASEAGVELTRFQVGETERDGSRLSLLALTLDGEGTLEQIQSLLIAVRGAEPAILIEEAAIRATGRTGRMTLALDLRAPVLEID
ncbi:type II secretion system protein GspM [Nisaea acidiphila]|uniref:Type II secretion system protein GspM n=1 Tax=Nisaea acidiphila TaxID=1862145 RepID=A0A9J7ANY0_9PROT|nr:type II secretion system protein GspM [Nisaea acidiphila]UUX48626.1 type II secretion system protein GspM [Nisaea acidiphila]